MENLTLMCNAPADPSRRQLTRAAAFALLGMINWIYQWYQPQGPLIEADISRQYTEIAGAFHQNFREETRLSS